MTETLTTTSVQTIENATRKDIIPGDHITWEATETIRGLTKTARREGIAHHRDVFNNWRTEDGDCITVGVDEDEGVTITIRRTIQDLPTKPGTVIVANDGHDGIDAEDGGSVWRANEAILGANGRWCGVWRRASGFYIQTDPMKLPESIIQGTWKVEEK